MVSKKEWIQQALAHREDVAVPYNFMFSPPARQKVEQHYGGAPIEKVLGFPIRITAPTSIKPLYASPQEFGESVADEFGVVWSTNDVDRGSPIGPCLPEPDLANYTFPDAAEERRFEALGRRCEASRKSYVVIAVGDLWERATFMRGMENILLDVALHPEFVRHLLRGIADYILQTMETLFARFRFDSIFLSDDYGTQKDMLMSPQAWRRFIRPLLEEIFSLAKKNGRTVFLHSCGNIYPIIGDLIDLGLDVLHPIQPEAMDILRLKREFGRDLTFCGGLPTQNLLPFGTPEEVREEVRRLKREMGRGGGYILEPGITLQADVPLEQLVAMIEEARNTD